MTCLPLKAPSSVFFSPSHGFCSISFVSTHIYFKLDTHLALRRQGQPAKESTLLFFSEPGLPHLYSVFQIHLFFCKFCFIFLYCWIKFHSVYGPHFSHSFVGGHLGWFHFLAFVKKARDELSYARVSMAGMESFIHTCVMCRFYLQISEKWSHWFPYSAPVYTST